MLGLRKVVKRDSAYAVRPVSDSPSTHDTPASDCAENESSRQHRFECVPESDRLAHKPLEGGDGAA